MSDLRGILGDRYDDVIEEAAGFLHALDWDGDEREAELVWANYSDMSVVRQECLRTVEAVLAAVLPDLLAAERERASADMDRIARALAAAWDAGMEFVRSHPGMAAEYYRAANPYRKEPR